VENAESLSPIVEKRGGRATSACVIGAALDAEDRKIPSTLCFRFSQGFRDPDVIAIAALAIDIHDVQA
jgi:hypothetical protein